MRRLGAEHSNEVALVCAHCDALGQHDLFPPAAQSLELQVALVSNHCYQEAHLVHVPGKQHARGAVLVYSLPALDSDYRTKVIRHDFAEWGEVTPHDLADRSFLAGYARSLSQ